MHETEHPDVSVNVLIYNASWERVRATFNSILMQKGINFEIVIIDDCSKENHSDRIKDFFSRNDFTNYRLIVHEKNLGTVKTYLEAVRGSSAEYIRGLDPGDMFLDEYVLRDSYNCIVSTGSDIIASTMVYYRAFSNPAELVAHHRYPQNIKAYDDPEELRVSYLLHDDRVSGSSTICRRDVLIRYLKEADDNGIKYYDDYTIKFMVFDKIRIKFFDRPTIYYEYGAGISTVQSNDTPYRSKEVFEAMLLDEYKTSDMLLKRCKNFPSEFSKKLASLITNRRKIEAEIKYRKSLKDRFGIAAVPVILARSLLRGAMIALGLEMKAEVPLEIGDIMTDTNVSTDFANLCMNRE